MCEQAAKDRKNGLICTKIRQRLRSITLTPSRRRINTGNLTPGPYQIGVASHRLFRPQYRMIQGVRSSNLSCFLAGVPLQLKERPPVESQGIGRKSKSEVSSHSPRASATVVPRSVCIPLDSRDGCDNPDSAIRHGQQRLSSARASSLRASQNSQPNHNREPREDFSGIQYGVQKAIDEGNVAQPSAHGV